MNAHNPVHLERALSNKFFEEGDGSVITALQKADRLHINDKPTLYRRYMRKKTIVEGDRRGKRNINKAFTAPPYPIKHLASFMSGESFTFWYPGV